MIFSFRFRYSEFGNQPDGELPYPFNLFRRKVRRLLHISKSGKECLLNVR